jgi:hypothetical protein
MFKMKNIKLFLVFIVVILFFVVFSNSIFAADQVNLKLLEQKKIKPTAMSDFYVVADCYTYSSSPNNNYNDSYLYIGDSGGYFETYLYFDVSSIPANATITNASLSFKKNYTNTSGSLAVALYRRTSSWSETGATWNSESGKGVLLGGVLINVDLSYPNIINEPELTDMVQYWVDNTNYGMSIRTAAADGKYISLFSSEGGYSTVLSVEYTVPATLPTVSTNTVTSITTTSAVCGGNVTSDGGATVTARGVCWSSSTSSPTTSNSHTTNGSGTGSFTSNMSGLSPNTFYYVRAYATNSQGTSYGSTRTFTTPPPSTTPPTVSTNTVSSIGTTSAVCGGNVTSDGGASVTARGVCWSSSTSSPTTSNSHTTNGSGTGSFTSSITGLSPGTTYYVRAYATNSQGTSYGSSKSFTTNSSITVTSPNGGEWWQVGTNHNITWTTTGTVGNVKIEYSTDNGSTWSTVVSSTLNDGNYEWTVPSTPSTQYLIKISDASNSSITDTSDTVFTISEFIPANHFAYSGSWTSLGHGADDWYVGDFNGDGKSDIFRYMPGTSGADVFLSDGAKFVHNGSWTGSGHGIEGWYIGDFNGDGMDDIFRYIPGTSGADVFLSDGTKFVHNSSWTGSGHGTEGWYVGDFNGDGTDDIFRYVLGVSGADVFLSDGTKFVYDGSWTSSGHGTEGWYIGDFNGDGMDDIFRYVLGVSGAEVCLS